MSELITLAIDVALGALAYRLALQNRAEIKEVRVGLAQNTADINLLKEKLLERDSN